MAKRDTLYLSEPLREAAEILCRRRKYRTLSEYVAGLIRYDGQSQREHHLTAEWASLKGVERDRLDDRILHQVKTGQGIAGSWLEARIDECVKRHVEAGRVPTTAAVAKELAKRIAEGS